MSHHSTSFCSFRAAVASIVLTVIMVVLVVTKAVTFQSRRMATHGTLIILIARIEAFALECKIHVRMCVMSCAISHHSYTYFNYITLSAASRGQLIHNNAVVFYFVSICAIIPDHSPSCRSFVATVAAIPSAPSVVVLGVAISVFHVPWESARCRPHTKVVWIEAFALTKVEPSQLFHQPICIQLMMQFIVHLWLNEFMANTN